VRGKGNSLGKLWYQRLKLDNKFFAAAIYVAIYSEYFSVPFIIGMPASYYLSFPALTLYVNMVVVLILGSFYTPRLMRKFRKMLDELKQEEILSDEAASQMLDKTTREIHGREEKYLPLLFGALTASAFIYDDLSKGLLGMWSFEDFEGNVFCIHCFPFTWIHDVLLPLEIFLLVVLTFSTLIVVWKVIRSAVPKREHINLHVISAERTGGLDPVGKLIAEAVLLIMFISTFYAALGATYFMITGTPHLAIMIAVILSYFFVFVLIPRPLLAIHRIMATKKRETLNQITREIENLRRRIASGDLGATETQLALNSLLMMLGEVRKMRTFPLDAPSTRKITWLILTPVLSSLPIVLESYLGELRLVAPMVVGSLSILLQMFSLSPRTD